MRQINEETLLDLLFYLAMIVFGVVIAGGCAYEVVVDEPVLLVSATTPPDLQNDFNNCNVPGYACNPADADICSEGHCRCGFSAECGSGEDCRFGRCISSDPAGKGCEFDDECGEGNTLACVEAHCSPTGCLPWEQGELNCNGKDDDCDGCIDGVLGPDGICIHKGAREFDAHFFVDPSGSMSREMSSVTEVSGRFSEKFSGNPAYTFGATLIPSYEVDGQPELFTDQTDYDSFMVALQGLHTASQGDEPQYDGVYEAGTGELPISWRPGATRILVVLTDEEGQNYRSDFGLSPVDEATMCGALTHGEVLVFFALGEFASDFNACAPVFELHQSVEQILNALNGIIDDPCAL